MAALVEEKVVAPLGSVQLNRAGSGRTLVYLHSAQGEGAGQPLLEELADSFEVIGPLFPGFGESEGIERIDDIEDAAFHVADVLDALGLDQPALVGQSLGAWMAVEVATRWPHRVSAMVLVNPVGLYIEGAPIREIFGRDPGELAEDLFFDQRHPLAALMHQMAELGNTITGSIPFEMIKPTLQSLAATAKVGWNPYMHNPKLRARLHRVTAPTLVVRGAQDRLVPEPHAKAFVEGIPEASLEIIEEAGHLVALEKPGELVRLIRDFLS